MSAEIAGRAFQRMQPAKVTSFAGGQRSNVRQNRRSGAIGGRSGRKSRLSPAVDEVMSGKIAAGDFAQ